MKSNVPETQQQTFSQQTSQNFTSHNKYLPEFIISSFYKNNYAKDFKPNEQIEIYYANFLDLKKRLESKLTDGEPSAHFLEILKGSEYTGPKFQRLIDELKNHLVRLSEKEKQKIQDIKRKEIDVISYLCFFSENPAEKDLSILGTNIREYEHQIQQLQIIQKKIFSHEKHLEKSLRKNSKISGHEKDFGKILGKNEELLILHNTEKKLKKLTRKNPKNEQKGKEENVQNNEKQSDMEKKVQELDRQLAKMNLEKDIEQKKKQLIKELHISKDFLEIGKNDSQNFEDLQYEVLKNPKLSLEFFTSDSRVKKDSNLSKTAENLYYGILYYGILPQKLYYGILPKKKKGLFDEFPNLKENQNIQNHEKQIKNQKQQIQRLDHALKKNQTESAEEVFNRLRDFCKMIKENDKLFEIDDRSSGKNFKRQNSIEFYKFQDEMIKLLEKEEKERIQNEKKITAESLSALIKSKKEALTQLDKRYEDEQKNIELIKIPEIKKSFADERENLEKLLIEAEPIEIKMKKQEIENLRKKKEEQIEEARNKVLDYEMNLVCSYDPNSYAGKRKKKQLQEYGYMEFPIQIKIKPIEDYFLVEEKKLQAELKDLIKNHSSQLFNQITERLKALVDEEDTAIRNPKNKSNYDYYEEKAKIKNYYDSEIEKLEKKTKKLNVPGGYFTSIRNEYEIQIQRGRNILQQMNKGITQNDVQQNQGFYKRLIKVLEYMAGNQRPKPWKRWYIHDPQPQLNFQTKKGFYKKGGNTKITKSLDDGFIEDLKSQQNFQTKQAEYNLFLNNTRIVFAKSLAIYINGKEESFVTISENERNEFNNGLNLYKNMVDTRKQKIAEKIKILSEKKKAFEKMRELYLKSPDIPKSFFEENDNLFLDILNSVSTITSAIENLTIESFFFNQNESIDINNRFAHIEKEIEEKTFGLGNQNNGLNIMYNIENSFNYIEKKIEEYGFCLWLTNFRSSKH